MFITTLRVSINAALSGGIPKQPTALPRFTWWVIHFERYRLQNKRPYKNNNRSNYGRLSIFSR